MSDPRELLTLRMGDNALILAQQNAKWCGHAPTLEEDIALSNVALDLIGQARLWLSLAAAIEDKGRNENTLAFFRDSHAFRNAYLCEQPNGDFAQTTMRQYLFDRWHIARIENLCASSDQKIAEIAQKAINEVRYHLKRSRGLVLRLGDGSAESLSRMQNALTIIWPAFGSFFEDAKSDLQLDKDKIAPLPSSLRGKVMKALQDDLSMTQLKLPDSEYWHRGAVDGRHSENLGHILSDMQFLQRAYPGLEW